MKKQYKKPYLGLESFQLNAALAAACSSSSGSGRRTPINHGETTCSYPIGSGQFFSAYNCQVDLTDATVDGNDTLCYHGPGLSNGMVFTFS